MCAVNNNDANLTALFIEKLLLCLGGSLSY